MGSLFGSLGIDVLEAGWRFAVPETWRQWEQRKDAELWEAVALMCVIDPSSISSSTRLLGPEYYRWRLQLALDWLTRLDPIKFNTQDPVRSTILLSRFYFWASEMGLPIPEEFPSADEFEQLFWDYDAVEQDPVLAALMPKANSGPPVQWRGEPPQRAEPAIEELKPAAPQPQADQDEPPARPKRSKAKRTTAPATDFLRIEDVLALLQISKATLYRYIKEGKLPAPLKPSPQISVWNREELLRCWEAIGQ